MSKKSSNKIPKAPPISGLYSKSNKNKPQNPNNEDLLVNKLSLELLREFPEEIGGVTQAEHQKRIKHILRANELTLTPGLAHHLQDLFVESLQLQQAFAASSTDKDGKISVDNIYKDIQYDIESTAKKSKDKRLDAFIQSNNNLTPQELEALQKDYKAADYHIALVQRYRQIEDPAFKGKGEGGNMACNSLKGYSFWIKAYTAYLKNYEPQKIDEINRLSKIGKEISQTTASAYKLQNYGGPVINEEVGKILNSLQQDRQVVTYYENFQGGHANIIQYSLRNDGYMEMTFCNSGGGVDEDNKKIQNVNIEEMVDGKIVKKTVKQKQKELKEQGIETFSGTITYLIKPENIQKVIENNVKQTALSAPGRTDTPIDPSLYERAYPSDNKQIVPQKYGTCTVTSVANYLRHYMDDSEFRNLDHFIKHTPLTDIKKIFNIPNEPTLLSSYDRRARIKQGEKTGIGFNSVAREALVKTCAEKFVTDNGIDSVLGQKLWQQTFLAAKEEGNILLSRQMLDHTVVKYLKTVIDEQGGNITPDKYEIIKKKWQEKIISTPEVANEVKAIVIKSMQMEDPYNNSLNYPKSFSVNDIYNSLKKPNAREQIASQYLLEKKQEEQNTTKKLVNELADKFATNYPNFSKKQHLDNINETLRRLAVPMTTEVYKVFDTNFQKNARYYRNNTDPLTKAYKAVLSDLYHRSPEIQLVKEKIKADRQLSTTPHATKFAEMRKEFASKFASTNSNLSSSTPPAKPVADPKLETSTLKIDLDSCIDIISGKVINKQQTNIDVNRVRYILEDTLDPLGVNKKIKVEPTIFEPVVEALTKIIVENKGYQSGDRSKLVKKLQNEIINSKKFEPEVQAIVYKAIDDKLRSKNPHAQTNFPKNVTIEDIYQALIKQNSKNPKHVISTSAKPAAVATTNEKIANMMYSISDRMSDKYKVTAKEMDNIVLAATSILYKSESNPKVTQIMLNPLGKLIDNHLNLYKSSIKTSPAIVAQELQQKIVDSKYVDPVIKANIYLDMLKKDKNLVTPFPKQTGKPSFEYIYNCLNAIKNKNLDQSENVKIDKVQSKTYSHSHRSTLKTKSSHQK